MQQVVQNLLNQMLIIHIHVPNAGEFFPGLEIIRIISVL